MPAATRHVPMRRCVVCRSILPQSELIRFARDDEGQWQLDSRRRAGGRGMWVCGNAGCHQQKALGRAFRAQAAGVAGQLARFDRQRGDRMDESAAEPIAGSGAMSRARRRVQVKRSADTGRIDETKSQDGGIDG